MSRLPARALLALLPLAAACSGSAPVPGDEARQPAVTRIDSTAVVLATGQGLGDPSRAVIRDSTAWAAFWTQAHALVEPAPPVPAVDFDKEMLLVAALGTRSSGGHAVTIDSVARGATLRAFVTAVAPGADCMTTMAITWPVQVVRVPRFDGSVEFVEGERVQPCG
ncbi:MAG: protease complex subunit PrcB family protein [Gemmatimonadales bacterium]